MEVTIKTIEGAYRKLKSNTYQNKADLHFMRRLAIFESSGDVDARLTSLFEKLGRFRREQAYFQSLYDQVKVIAMPKLISGKKLSENLISNDRESASYKIERTTYLIDAPVELQILDVLWIMLIGFKLDSQLEASCLGNRLALNSEKKLDENDLNLFRPYPRQYQKWRDGGLNEAERLLTQHTDVAFLSLDLQDYYHSVRLSYVELDNEIVNSDYSPFERHVHDVFKATHRAYCKLLNNQIKDDTSNELENFFLPIGLPSSYVLGNWYLKDFDRQAREITRPAYYSRYVDDIIFVIKDPIAPGTIKKKITGAADIADYLIYTYLKGLIEKGANGFHLKSRPSLLFQREKTHILHFDHTGSRGVLDALKRDIIKRSSEFRFSSDDELEAIPFESEAYELIFDGSEGKLRTLKDYRENRYGLSIYLTKHIFAALKQQKGIDAKASKNVLSIFRGVNSLDYCRIWERALTFFVVQGNVAAIIKMVGHTLEQISRIEETDTDESRIQKSLRRYLIAALGISLALDPSLADVKLKRLLDKWGIKVDLEFECSIYRHARLIRHYYVAQPLLGFTSIALDHSFSLVERYFPANAVSNEEFKVDIKYSPIKVKYYEAAVFVAQVYISSPKLREAEKDWDTSYLDTAFELYYKLNYGFGDRDQVHFDEKRDELFCIGYREGPNAGIRLQEISVESTIDDLCIDVALGNLKVNPKNDERSLRGRPILLVEREKEFDKLLKDSARAKAHMLFLPEICVPHDLCWLFTQHAFRFNQAIVVGLEHWLVNSSVSNYVLTVLPVRNGAFADAVPIFRLKNHYSPKELEIIHNFGFKEEIPAKPLYHIFHWNKIYFTVFYCFELANISDRAKFKAMVDLLVCSEFNKDTNYFSDIVGAASRDLHCFVAQVNTSQYGDSRITSPSKRELMDIVKLKGGENQCFLIGKIDFGGLREFQIQYNPPNDDPCSSVPFKPVPPSFDRSKVKKRMDNLPMLKPRKKSKTT